MNLSSELKRYGSVAEPPDTMRYEDGDFTLVFDVPDEDRDRFLDELDSVPTIRDLMVKDDRIFAVFYPLRRAIFKKLS